jgi:molecular chaperone HscB
VICWSCEKSVEGQTFCPNCQAIQPADAGADHFAVLGVGRGFAVDLEAVEKGYRELSRQIHPDRFARADARARRASMERSVQLNSAWRTLRDPVKRAEYLLSLSGFEVGGEEGTFRRAADGRKEPVAVPQELLLEVMELREGLLEARTAGDERQVAALSAQVQGRRQHGMDRVAAALAATPPALEAASRELVAVRYYDRFLEEVQAHEADHEADKEADHADRARVPHG